MNSLGARPGCLQLLPGSDDAADSGRVMNQATTDRVMCGTLRAAPRKKQSV